MQRNKLAGVERGERERQLRADQRKWELVADAMGHMDDDREQETRQLKHPAPQNRSERRAEQKRLGRFKRGTQR